MPKPQDAPLELTKDSRNLRPKVDERKSTWVLLHTQRYYLLPVIARGEKFIPTFNEDGSVTLETVHENPHLLPLVDKFVSGLGTVKREISVDLGEHGKLTVTPSEFSDLMVLVRALLLVNYDLNNDELQSLLTVTPAQMSQLYAAIIKHVSAR
ncbi:MAG: hypothetical protein JWP44_4131 [Mucilaginibacter sp.]|nr:hypothetical protein [Mucilaginibacter sp.]